MPFLVAKEGRFHRSLDKQNCRKETKTSPSGYSVQRVYNIDFLCIDRNWSGQDGQVIITPAYVIMLMSTSCFHVDKWGCIAMVDHLGLTRLMVENKGNTTKMISFANWSTECTNADGQAGPDTSA